MRIAVAGGGIAKRTLSKSGPHPLDDFKRVVDLNLIASFNLLRLEADVMSRNDPNEHGERGVVINTASIAGLSGDGGPLVYSAAKAAVINLTQGMAVEMAPDIRVNCVCPVSAATQIKSLCGR